MDKMLLMVSCTIFVRHVRRNCSFRGLTIRAPYGCGQQCRNQIVLIHN